VASKRLASESKRLASAQEAASPQALPCTESDDELIAMLAGCASMAIGQAWQEAKLLRQQQQARREAKLRDRAARREAKLLRQQQQRDRPARRKTRAVVRDEGEPAAQRLATQVVKLLLQPIKFARCLASLKRSKVWRVVLRYAQLLLQAPAQIFYVDIEGRKKIGAWEVAIVKQNNR
jgi:hypothetical protein